MMSLRARAGAARRLAWRHKAASAVLAACAALAVGGGTAAATSGQGSGPGPMAAPFTLPALGHPGQKVSLSQYAGRPVIVNFFASWCRPCQKETPLIARYYRSQGGRVAVVGLDENDSSQAAQAFLRKTGVSYPVGFDPSVQAASAYGVTGLPQTFFLNASHHVVKRIYGALTRADLTSGTALMDAGSHSGTGGAHATAQQGALFRYQRAIPCPQPDTRGGERGRKGRLPAFALVAVLAAGAGAAAVCGAGSRRTRQLPADFQVVPR